MNWSSLLDDFGKEILRELGEEPDWLPTSYNPITKALREPDFVDRFKDLSGFSRVALSRVATICQMVVFDAQRGPEGDGKCKALRRHWYQWYKLEFAHPLAHQIGDYEINAQGVKNVNDLAWTQRLSQTYAKFVDTGEVTYKDLWVEDASRMMKSFWDRLFHGCHIVVCVEKDSLFEDFSQAANALGAQALLSGKGKSSKAAVERMLRQHFNWYNDYDNSFTFDTPLIVLSITDWDFDGEAVIAPTFATQASRYTKHVLEARVGISPPQVTASGQQLDGRWYTLKVSNAGYREWAEENALFLARCPSCLHQWPVVSTGQVVPHVCPICSGEADMIEVGTDIAHGFEVEAMLTRDYRPLLVDALLSVLPFEYILEKLRDECRANARDAAEHILPDICAENKSYQVLLAAFNVLEEAKSNFENDVRDALQALGDPHRDDWRDDDDNPTPDDYREHVTNGYSPWRPFDTADRTAKLIDWLIENCDDTIQDFKDREITWEFD